MACVFQRLTSTPAGLIFAAKLRTRRSYQLRVVRCKAAVEQKRVPLVGDHLPGKQWRCLTGKNGLPHFVVRPTYTVSAGMCLPFFRVT